MSNTSLTADIILKEAQRVFHNNIPFTKSMSKSYDDSYKAYGAKSGDSIRIQRPMQYSVSTGKTLSVHDNVESAVTLQKGTQLNVGLKFSSKELTLDIDRFSELYATPAAIALANQVEVNNMTAAYKATYNAVTLPVTAIDRTDLIQSGVILDEFSTPRDTMRYGVLNPKAQGDLVDGNASLFNPSSYIGNQYQTGIIGNAYGFNLSMGQSVPSHTTGTYNGAHVVDGASQTGATLTVKTGTGAPTEGDTFTIAGVYALNKVTKASTGRLQRFVVGAGATSTSWPISPSIVTTGAQATVSASPAADAVITEMGLASTAYPQNLVYHKQAFAFGTADLELPGNSKFESRIVMDSISMRLIKFYEGINDDCYYRLDVLSGIVAVQPEYACRIYGV